jgi:hypothetical protein
LTNVNEGLGPQAEASVRDRAKRMKLLHALIVMSVARRSQMKAPMAPLVLVTLVIFVAPQQAVAQSLEGTWSGSGAAKPTSGQTERVRCRITYGRENPKVFSVAATCATPSVTFHQTGTLLMVSPTRFVGDFYNPEYDVSGRVRVTLKGSTQTVTFSGPKGTGSMTLTRR